MVLSWSKFGVSRQAASFSGYVIAAVSDDSLASLDVFGHWGRVGFFNIWFSHGISGVPGSSE